MTESERLVEYLRRSYQAVDGLWFTQVEAAQGFEAALEMDARVWEVLAKIQARKARELLGLEGNSLAELARGFTLKLQADGYEFEERRTEAAVHFHIASCPWLEILRRSGRGELAAPIAEVMCPTEGRMWAREFGDTVEFSVSVRACLGGGRCEMVFARKER